MKKTVSKKIKLPTLAEKKLNDMEGKYLDQKNSAEFWKKEAAMFKKKHEDMKAAYELVSKERKQLYSDNAKLKMTVNALEIQNGLLEKIITGSKKMLDNVLEFSDINAQNRLHRQDIYKSREILREGLDDIDKMK